MSYGRGPLSSIDSRQSVPRLKQLSLGSNRLGRSVHMSLSMGFLCLRGAYVQVEHLVAIRHEVGDRLEALVILGCDLLEHPPHVLLAFEVDP